MCCSLILPKVGPGHGTDEDNEVKGPMLVLADPGCPIALVSLALQLQPLSHPQLSDVLGRTDLYLKWLAINPRAACRGEILAGTTWEESKGSLRKPPSLPVHGLEIQMEREDLTVWLM